jgi:hypothetical protein
MTLWRGFFGTQIVERDGLPQVREFAAQSRNLANQLCKPNGGAWGTMHHDIVFFGRRGEILREVAIKCFADDLTLAHLLLDGRISNRVNVVGHE